MKVKFLLFLTSLFLVMTTNRIWAQDAAIQFTVKETPTEFTIHLLTFDKLVIDWGDGETFTIDEATPRQIPVTHTYSDNKERTISLFGDKINNIALNDKGIESITFGDKADLTFLSELYLVNNELTSLNLSALENLLVLNCSNNNLTSVDLSKNVKLGRLTVIGNALDGLNLEHNLDLIYLNATNTGISVLDLTENTILKELHLNDNNLTSLSLSGLSLLENLFCANNKIESLDLSQSPGLKKLVCGKNKLTEIDLHPSIVSLDELQCENNRLNLATLPLVTQADLNTNFTYSPQDSLVMDNRVNNFSVDLSDQISVTKRGQTATTLSNIIWFDAKTNLPIYSFTVNEGVYTFDVEPNSEIWIRAEIKNRGYSALTIKTPIVKLSGLASSIDEVADDAGFSYNNGIITFWEEDVDCYISLSELSGKNLISVKNNQKTVDLTAFVQKNEPYILSIVFRNKKVSIKLLG